MNAKCLEVAVRVVLRGAPANVTEMARRLESMGWQAPSDAELQAALAAMGAWQSPEGIWHLHRPPQTTSHRSTTLAAELGIDPAELEAEETRSQTSEPPRVLTVASDADERVD